MKKLIKSLFIIQVIGILSLFFLVAAYFLQYVLGVQPCKLCIYQRIPYLLLVFLGGVSLIGFMKNHYHKMMLIFCRLLILVEIFLAIYHVGIERDIFQEVVPCKIESSTASVTMDSLRAQIYNNKEVSCKEVSMRILGLSLAEINLVLAVFLLLLTFNVPFKNRFLSLSYFY